MNIHEVLEHVIRLARTGFGAGVQIKELYDPSLPPVYGSRDELIELRSAAHKDTMRMRHDQLPNVKREAAHRSKLLDW